MCVCTVYQNVAAEQIGDYTLAYPHSGEQRVIHCPSPVPTFQFLVPTDLLLVPSPSAPIFNRLTFQRSHFFLSLQCLQISILVAFSSPGFTLLQFLMPSALICPYCGLGSPELTLLMDQQQHPSTVPTSLSQSLRAHWQCHRHLTFQFPAQPVANTFAQLPAPVTNAICTRPPPTQPVVSMFLASSASFAPAIPLSGHQF